MIDVTGLPAACGTQDTASHGRSRSGMHDPAAPVFHPAAVQAPTRVDGHVHLVGNGRSGSGCWIRLRGWHRMMAGIISRALGWKVALHSPDFDETFEQQLAGWVRESAEIDQVLLLAQDEVYHPDGRKRDFGSFHVPNDHLFAVCERNPDLFLPAVSIHPARPDALEELDRCLQRGARALKLLPNCLDVDCSAPQYDRFWETMAAAGLPLLAHTGGERTVPVANPAYQDPKILLRPLEIGVKVIAAHAASRSGLFDPDFVDSLLEMMRRHPNLYADTSALNTPFRSAAYAKILRCDLPERFLHGSDFPVPVSPWYARMRGLIGEKARRHAAATANPIERDARLKRAIGFPSPHFTRIHHVLRPL